MKTKLAKEMGGKLFKEQWGATLLALLLALAGTIAANAAVPIIGGLIVQGPISVGLLYVYYKASCGEKIVHKEMLIGFKTNFGEIVLGALLKSVFISAISAIAYGLIATFAAAFFFAPVVAVILDILVGIAAVVAVIIVSLYLAAVEYILMREPEAKGWEAVKKSKRIMTGYTGRLFGFTLSFIGWFILTVIFLPLAIYTVPYYYISRVCLLESIYKAGERKAQEEKAAAEKAREEAKAAPAPGRKFCTSCGASIAEEAAFCSKCGKKQ